MGITNGMSFMGGGTYRQFINQVNNYKINNTTTSSGNSTPSTSTSNAINNAVLNAYKTGVQINNTQINKVLHAWQNMVNTMVTTGNQLNKTLLSLLNSATKTADSIGDVTQRFSQFNSKDISNATKNLGDSLTGIKDNFNTIGAQFDKDALGNIHEASTASKNLASNLNDLNKIDAKSLAQGLSRSRMLAYNARDNVNLFKNFDPKLINSLGNMGAGVLKRADGLIKMATMTNGDFSKAQRRDNKVAWANFNRMQKMNQISSTNAMKQRTAWFTELRKKGLGVSLFGEKDPTTGKKKDGTGLLGMDIKAGLLNALKGGLIGAVVGLIFKAIRGVIKLLLMPLNMAKKLVTGVFGFLKKSLYQAETFKKLIELVVLPFTLMFTLLFAPILVKLAPLLVDVIERVVSKWDVIESAGEKIGNILTYFFDDENWFSFGNVIDWIIDTIYEFAQYAERVFVGLRLMGYEGLDALTWTLTSVLNMASNKLIEFMVSGEGASLMINLGKIAGTLIYDGFKVLAVSLIPLLQGIWGIMQGIMTASLTDLFSAALNIVRWNIQNNPIMKWLGNVFGMSGTAVDPSTYQWSNTDAEITKLNEALSGSTVTNNDGSINYEQTWNNITTNYWGSSNSSTPTKVI